MPSQAEAIGKGHCPAGIVHCWGCTPDEPYFLLEQATTSICLPEGDLKYPQDFGDLRPYAEHCIDRRNELRHIFSNGIPGHDILIPPGRPPLCETEYDVVIPLFPKYVEFPTEIPSMGPIAFTLAGIPIYSAAWAVWNGHLFEESAWMGHPQTFTSQWHYHHPSLGTGSVRTLPSAETHVGYALDGFPIFGADPTLRLDECNGRCEMHFVEVTHIAPSSRAACWIKMATRPSAHSWP